MRVIGSTRGAGLATAFVVLLHSATPTPQERISPLFVTATSTADIQRVNAVMTRLRGRGDLRVTEAVPDPMLPGRAHQRLSQYHQDIRVIGSDLRVQTEDGITRSIFGQVHPELEVDVGSRLSVDEVLARVDPLGVRSLVAPTTLAVRPDPTRGVYRLVYELHTFGPDGVLTTHADALTGEVLARRTALRTQTATLPCADCAVGEGRGVKGDRKKLSVRTHAGGFAADDGLRPARVSTYDMRGNWARALDVLFGNGVLTASDLASDADNVWQDGASVDAHAGTGWTLDYLYHRFGYGGLDGDNSPVVILVHPVDRADVFTVPSEVASLFHLNAFFCGLCDAHGMVLLGEGLPPGQALGGTGQTLDYFSAGIDVVGHELGHAVTEFSSRLIYQGESGALNEAFSDLIGVGTEFFLAESGRHASEQADYLIGEDVIKPGGIRSLANPLSRGDPDHYSIRFLGESDNGGVHTNSTIASHVYYLVVEGGVNTTSGLTVPGVGVGHRPLVEQIFFRAFSMLLPTSATFSMARAATLQSAHDLGANESVQRAITAAWTAVGVE